MIWKRVERNDNFTIWNATSDQITALLHFISEWQSERKKKLLKQMHSKREMFETTRSRTHLKF